MSAPQHIAERMDVHVGDACDTDLRCPLCDYNLRGLVEPRCPECGFRFEWGELTDPDRRSHPYLFEHHPRRNVHSFVRTLWGSLRPRQFWASLRPSQPSRPLRLIAYWAIVSLLAVLIIVVGQLGRPARQWYKGRQDTLKYIAYLQSPQGARSATWHTQSHGSVQNFLTTAYAQGWMTDPSMDGLMRQLRNYSLRETNLVPWVALVVSWPWLTCAALLIFRASMRQARINGVHVMRCALYGADAFLLTGLILTLTTTTEPAGDEWRWWRMVAGVSRGEVAAVAIILAMLVYRLCVAYRLYLRFPHAVATAACSQVITLLVIVELFLTRFHGL